MKKPARRLKHPKKILAKVHHQTYHKSMDPKQKISTGKLPTPLIIISTLVVLGAIFAFYLTQQKSPPKPAVSQTPPKAVSVLPPLPTRFLGCPLSESLCKTTDFYSTHVKDSSFSATLKADTPILAVFDGEMERTKLSRPSLGGKKEEFTLLTIINQKQKLVAEYYFKGKAIGKREVKQGEVVATTNGEPLNFLEGKSLVFIVLGMTEEGDSGLEPLEATHFK